MCHICIFMRRTLITVLTSPTIIHYFKWLATYFALSQIHHPNSNLKGDSSIIAWHVLLMTKAPFGRGQTPKLPLRWCLGGVSKSRPLRYQHSALPLSYPGICAAVIFTRNFPLKPRLTYFPRRPCATRGFSGLNAHEPARTSRHYVFLPTARLSLS